MIRNDNSQFYHNNYVIIDSIDEDYFRIYIIGKQKNYIKIKYYKIIFYFIMYFICLKKNI